MKTKLGSIRVGPKELHPLFFALEFIKAKGHLPTLALQTHLGQDLATMRDNALLRLSHESLWEPGTVPCPSKAHFWELSLGYAREPERFVEWKERCLDPAPGL